jgi:hypothetical protein
VERMIRKMGFTEQWIKLIMLCISSVKYHVKVNGSYTEEFIPQRGLRQGDVLSPYLFLIVVELYLFSLE